MDTDTLVERLATEGDRLLRAADQAGWSTAVPGLEWTVREVVAHCGGVHRWATAVIAARSPEEVDEAQRLVGAGPSEDEALPAWFAAGVAELVTALRDAPPDLQAFTFLPAPSPRHFWARRQAHETSIHRCDVEAAAGTVTDCDVAFADDGIAEVVEGFAARRRNAIPRPGVLALAPTDSAASWRLTFGGEKNLAHRGDPAGADTVVSGTSCEIYRWLWNRPAGVTVSGDPELAQLWAATVQVRW